MLATKRRLAGAYCSVPVLAQSLHNIRQPDCVNMGCISFSRWSGDGQAMVRARKTELVAWRAIRRGVMLCTAHGAWRASSSRRA